MIALTASLVLAFYLLLPEALARFIFNRFVPLRSFVRTRVEELNQSFVLLTVTLLVTWGLVWFVPPFNAHPFAFSDSRELRCADYKLVAASLYSEKEFEEQQPNFWPALNRTLWRQGRFLAWYYSLIALGAVTIGELCRRYGSLRKYPLYAWLADRFLLPNISEWHPLLTPFIFEDKQTAIKADLLCGDALYTGTVRQHFIDKEGKLTGIILMDPKRFDRKAYLEDKALGHSVESTEYWRDIPSAKLYFFASDIRNLNLNYESPNPRLEILRKYLEEILKTRLPVVIQTSAPIDQRSAEDDSPGP